MATSPSLTAALQERLARLGLAGRLRIATALVVIPMALSAALALATHWYAAAAWQDAAVRQGRMADILLRSAPLLRAAASSPDGDPAARQAALAGLRAHMRDASDAAGDPAVRAAARALDQAAGQHEAGKAGAAGLAALPPLFDKLGAAAARAAARDRADAASASSLAAAVMLLAPMLAAAAGILLARRVTRGIDGTLRNCIAFAGDIAAGNFRHGGAHARPGARARHMHAPADSASEFDLLVRSMNGIAEETLAAAEREVEHVARLERVERSWALLSACSRSLVKARGEAALTDAICHHLVELGGYRIAWVGYARDGEGRPVEPVSHAGTDRDYVHGLHLSWGDDVHKQGGFGTAIHQRRMLVCKRLRDDLVFTSWKAVAPPHGVVACIALPLLDEGGAFGVLGLYTDDAKALDDEEVRLLQDLADDLAFGIASRRDHAKRAEAEEELAHHTHYDGLTGLALPRTLQAELAGMAGDVGHPGGHGAGHGDVRDGRRRMAALHVNIDRFREFNAAQGREAGDRLLVQVARRLRQSCGHQALLARAGADEFIAVLPSITGSGQAAETAARLLASLDDAAPEADGAVRPRASLGVSLYPDDASDTDAMQRHAALAMQDAKRDGGNAWRFYSKDLNARALARRAMEDDLRQALARGELAMHYQPQCSLVTGGIVGVEALLRWRHPVRGVLAAHEFLRVAEEAGLMAPFGDWAIDTVCAQIHAWRAAGLHVPPVALNLTARQFHRPGLVEVVRAAMARHQVPEKALELEVREVALMRDVEEAIGTLRALKALGVRIALDDFGTGYSSLSQLRRFPLDHVKIDPSFVHGVVAEPDAAAACNAVIALAHSLHLGVIAEGVETDEQVNYLRRRHCDAMQGYLFSRAVPPDALAALLSSGRKLLLAGHGEPARTLLLLDDEPANVRALNRALRQDGYKILAATSTTDALKLLANNPVQVVLADQDMPDMTGAEFMRRVKDLYPATVRIVLSGYTGLEPVITAINQGAIYRFFPTPWNEDELRACIQAAFRHTP